MIRNRPHEWESALDFIYKADQHAWGRPLGYHIEAEGIECTNKESVE